MAYPASSYGSKPQRLGDEIAKVALGNKTKRFCNSFKFLTKCNFCYLEKSLMNKESII